MKSERSDGLRKNLEWRRREIEGALHALASPIPKELAPPLRALLSGVFAKLRLLLPLPDRFIGEKIEEWALGLHLKSSTKDERIYEREGIIYVIPNESVYFLGLASSIFHINLVCEYEDPPVIVCKGDVVIDCGANIGVATLLFAKKAGNGGKVIAVEPEEKNYRVLEKVSKLNEEKVAKIIPLKVAVYKEDCELELNIGTGPDTHTLSQYAEDRKDHILPIKEKVEARKIDTIVHLLGLERVDFIKMDIEGAEVDALLGAEQTIKKFKPKLAICTYHRPTDPVEIRKILLRYNPDYKFKELGRGEGKGHEVLLAWD